MSANRDNQNEFRYSKSNLVDGTVVSADDFNPVRDEIKAEFNTTVNKYLNTWNSRVVDQETVVIDSDDKVRDYVVKARRIQTFEDKTSVNLLASDNGKILVVNANSNAKEMVCPNYNELVEGWDADVMKIDSSGNDVTFNPGTGQTINGLDQVAVKRASKPFQVIKIKKDDRTPNNFIIPDYSDPASFLPDDETGTEMGPEDFLVYRNINPDIANDTGVTKKITFLNHANEVMQKTYRDFPLPNNLGNGSGFGPGILWKFDEALNEVPAEFGYEFVNKSNSFGYDVGAIVKVFTDPTDNIRQPSLIADSKKMFLAFYRPWHGRFIDGLPFNSMDSGVIDNNPLFGNDRSAIPSVFDVRLYYYTYAKAKDSTE